MRNFYATELSFGNDSRTTSSWRILKFSSKEKRDLSCGTIGDGEDKTKIIAKTIRELSAREIRGAVFIN
jgi:hypothetical protein